jgi:hypothetical protein
MMAYAANMMKNVTKNPTIVEVWIALPLVGLEDPLLLTEITYLKVIASTSFSIPSKIVWLMY